MTKTLSKIMHNGDEYNFPAWVEWPSSSTDGHLAVFDWATWKLIKDWWAVPTVPTNVSSFNNDAGYLTSSTWVTSVNSHTWAVTVNEVPSGWSIWQLLTWTWSWPVWMNGIMERVASLDAADWSNKEQTVNVMWVTTTNIIIVSPDPANINDYASNSVYCSAQGSGTLTFKCNTVPSVDINVNILTIN